MESAVEKLRSLEQSPSTSDFFSILFETVGIRIVDTGEELSCYHQGQHIEFCEQLNESAVNYVLELTTEQVDNLVELLSFKDIDEVRRYNILKTLFQPTIEASINPFPCLKKVPFAIPLASNTLIRRLLRMENIIHVYIIPPSQDEPEIGHTLVFEKKEWLVSPGLHGEPGRVFRLTVDDALEFHKRVFSALKIDSSRGWIVFARWYLKWRNRVSERQE